MEDSIAEAEALPLNTRVSSFLSNPRVDNTFDLNYKDLNVNYKDFNWKKFWDAVFKKLKSVKNRNALNGVYIHIFIYILLAYLELALDFWLLLDFINSQNLGGKRYQRGYYRKWTSVHQTRMSWGELEFSGNFNHIHKVSPGSLPKK